MEVVNEYEGKVVVVTGGAKLFFLKGKALPLLSAMSKKPLLKKLEL